MKRQSQAPDGGNNSFAKGPPTIAAAMEYIAPSTDHKRQHFRNDNHDDDLQLQLQRQQVRGGKDRFESHFSRFLTSMDSRLSPVSIEEKCASKIDFVRRIPQSESSSMPWTSGLHQSLQPVRPWPLREETSKFQACDRESFGNSSESDMRGLLLEPFISRPLHLRVQDGEPESETAHSHIGDQSHSSNSHQRVDLSQGDSPFASSSSAMPPLSCSLSTVRDSPSRAPGSSKGDADASSRVATFPMAPSAGASPHKDIESSDENEADNTEVSCSDRGDSCSLVSWLPSPFEEDDASSSEESDSSYDGYSASSYASSCTETTLTPSTISADGALSLEVRWCQVEYAVIHPLMATLFSTIAVPNMEGLSFRPLRCLVSNAISGRITVRLQSTLALRQKSYLMDFVLPPRVVVLGQGIVSCSDDDFEEWWDVS